MFHAGTFAAGATVRIPWNTSAGDGSSITRSTNGTVAVWKDGGTTQSTAGVTDTEDFDSMTGMHMVVIDTSADGTFYSTGSEFHVAVTGATIDTETVNAWIGGFRLGVVPANVTQFGGTAGTFSGGRPEVNTTHAAGTAWGSGAITSGAFATGAITATAIAADAIGASELAADAASEIGTAVWATATRVLTANTNLSIPTASDIRSAVGLASANLDTQLTAIDDYLDTEIAAIKAKTDNLPASPAATGDIPSAASIADAVWDEAISGHQGAGSTGEALSDAGGAGTPPTVEEIRQEIDSNSTQLAAIVADTNELQTDWANGGRLDLILDARASQSSVDDVPTNSELSTALAAADDAVLAAIAALNNLSSAQAASAVLTTQMTESYNADGTAPTLAQAVFLILQMLTEKSVSSTTLTVKKLDGSTTAATFTLDSATEPTSITRAS